MNVKSENEQKHLSTTVYCCDSIERVYLKGTLAVPPQYYHYSSQKDFLHFKLHQKSFQFCGIKKEKWIWESSALC